MASLQYMVSNIVNTGRTKLNRLQTSKIFPANSSSIHAKMVSATTKTALHPFDPLTASEIESAISIVRKAHGEVFFNVVSLHEPRKAEMTKWLQDPTSASRPVRIADVVVIARGGKVYDGLVDLEDGKITKWELLEGLQPIVRPKLSFPLNTKA